MASLLEYKCPCCGGAISFDSTTQKMKCPFCDTEFDVETLKKYDEQLKKDEPDKITWNTSSGNEWTEDETTGMRVYVCNSCGGQIVGDENTAATSCPFCDNPVVMMGQLTGDLKPDYVIPFKLDKNVAKQRLLDHYQGKRLLPKVFKDQNHIDEIKGIYVPYWLFDADVDASVRYKGSRVTGAWSDADYDYTQISFFAVQRDGSISFQNVPADGSSKMEDDLMESLEPYDFSEAVDFQTAYLAGYLADKYDVTSEESIDRVNQRVKKSTEDMFASTVHNFDTIETEASTIHTKNGKAKYALYPVWLLNTTWNRQKYVFAMNGQTGKFVGDLPVDKKAYWRWWISIFLIVGVIAFIILGLFLN